MMAKMAVILAAAGRSARFGGGRNKLFARVGGEAVLARSVGAFAGRGDVAEIVVTTPDGGIWGDAPGEVVEALKGPKVRLCAGGGCRAESVWNAVRAVSAGAEWVAVHDAARPLVSQGLIDRTLAAALAHGAAGPAMAVTLTIKEAGGPLPARVERTVPRARLWAMQTPQIARREALLRAFEGCPIPLEQVTDDAQLLELAGDEVWLVEGEEGNMKITHGMDLAVAEMLVGRGGGSR